MTATMTSVPSRTSTTTTNAASRRFLWRSGLAAGVVAAAATAAVAAVAHAAGVSLETAPGEAIPVLGFAQLTLVCTVIGIVIARTLGRRASRPRSTFTHTTVVLTALSLVPDITLSAAASTKVTLMLTHLVAAAIVIPTLCARLPEVADYRGCRAPLPGRRPPAARAFAPVPIPAAKGGRALPAAKGPGERPARSSSR